MKKGKICISDELKEKYGKYRRQEDIFIFQNCIMSVEIIRPLRFHQFNTDKFIIGRINILGAVLD